MTSSPATHATVQPADPFNLPLLNDANMEDAS